MVQASDRGCTVKRVKILVVLVGIAYGAHTGATCGTASADTRKETTAVVSAREEIKAGREHLKRALLAQRTERKRQHALEKIVKLQAQIAKLKAPTSAAKVAPAVDYTNTDGDCGE